MKFFKQLKEVFNQRKEVEFDIWTDISVFGSFNLINISVSMKVYDIITKNIYNNMIFLKSITQVPSIW